MSRHGPIRGGDEAGASSADSGRPADSGAQTVLHEAERLVRISDVHLAADNPVAALEYLEEAEAQLAGVESPTDAVAGISLRMVDCHRRRGDLEAAQAKVSEALDLLGPEGDPLFRGKFLSRAAAIEYGLGRALWLWSVRPREFRRLVASGLRADHSWARPGQDYLDIYHGILRR